jgi:hypothetical protein
VFVDDPAHNKPRNQLKIEFTNKHLEIEHLETKWNLEKKLFKNWNWNLKKTLVFPHLHKVKEG